MKQAGEDAGAPRERLYGLAKGLSPMAKGRCGGSFPSTRAGQRSITIPIAWELLAHAPDAIRDALLAFP